MKEYQLVIELFWFLLALVAFILFKSSQDYSYEKISRDRINLYLSPKGQLDEASTKKTWQMRFIIALIIGFVAEGIKAYELNNFF